MLIKFWIGIMVSISLAILTILVFAKISKMMKKNPAAGGMTGFFVGVGIVIVFFLLPSRAYVITNQTDYEHYMVFGSPEFEMSDGQKVSISIASGKCMIINNTEDRVMIEEVIYGGYGFSPSPDQIAGMSYGYVETGSIDYFFDDMPPDEISVSEGSEAVSRFWVRRARE